jgi:membrane protein
VNPVDAWQRAVDRWRARSSHVDHAWRAKERYDEMFGPRLAAAIAYYGFFAAFALGLLGYSILGFVLGGNPAVNRTVDAYLSRNLPFLNPGAIRDARNTVAVLGLVGLVFSGTGWIDGMRSSQRAMWRLNQQPGNLFIRRLVDLAMLVGLGLLLGLSLWATSGVRDLVKDFLIADTTVLRWLGETLSVLVNLVTVAGLLIGVPRLKVPVRRMVGPILLVGLGLTALTTVGRIYISGTNNPVYRVAGAAVGLLVFLNLFSQLLLFGAALAATSDRGTVTDLAAGPVPAEGVES